MPHPKQATIDGLRKLADFLESRPGLTFYEEFDLSCFVYSDEEFTASVKAIGTFDKVFVGDFFVARKIFGGGVRFDVNRKRDKVCTRVVVGQKTIPAEPEKIITVPAKPERVEEVFEWQCPKSLLASGDHVLANDPEEDDEDDGDGEERTPLIPPVEEPAMSA